MSGRTSPERLDKLVPDLALLVIVTFNSQNVISTLLSSLERQDENRWEAIVVDNSATDAATKTAEIITTFNTQSGSSQPVIYMRTASNIGYLPAAALALAGVKVERYKRIVVCNPDVEFSASFISQILESPFEDEILAPSVVDRDSGEDQNPYLVQPVSFVRGVALAALELAPTRWRHAAISHATKRELRRTRPPAAPGMPIYAPHGSVIVLPTRFFTRGGHLRYPLPLYGEEEFIADQAKALGVNVICDPEIRVTHHSGHATSEASAFVLLSRRRARFHVLKARVTGAWTRRP